MKNLSLWQVGIWNGGSGYNHKNIYFSNSTAAVHFESENTYDRCFKLDLIVVDSLEEYEQQCEQSVRSKALSKLTQEEIRALNIKM